MIEVVKITADTLRSYPEMLAEYAAESSIEALGSPNPQWEMYERMESGGFMQALGVNVDGELAGFAFVLTTILPHYGVKASTMESLFVRKEKRRKGAGTALMAAVEDYARQQGSKVVFYSANGGRLEVLLGKRLTQTNSIFCKPLA
jgi:GNAT superfamily N-acetyltransferase